MSICIYELKVKCHSEKRKVNNHITEIIDCRLLVCWFVEMYINMIKDSYKCKFKQMG